MTRLAYLLKKFPRLSETFVLTELLGQEEQGIDLAVLSRRPPDDELRHPELARLRAPVEVLPGRSSLDPWGELFDPEGREPDPGDWSRLGGAVRELRPLLGPRVPIVVAEALHVRRRLAELGAEHVHVHFATESAVVAWLVRRLGGPPYSITAHAKDLYRGTVRPELLELLVGGSAFTVTVCDANVAHLRGMLSPAAGARVRRLYNGLALERFPYVEGPRDEGHVLAVGRLIEKKGFDVLLDALAILRDRGVRVGATLVGDGDDREELEARARALFLGPERLCMTGPLDQGAVRELLSHATVFALPCVIGADGNRDALPTVLLEALAHGLPSISTPVTGVPEILADGAAGKLVPQRDPVALADAIAALLADPSRRAELARAGRARAEALFDSRTAARTLAGWFRGAPQEAGAAAEVAP